VRARQIRREICLRSAAAFPVLVSNLVKESTFLLRAIVIGIQRDALHRRRVEEKLADIAIVTRIGHVQRAVLAVEIVLELFVIFSALKQRQHLIVGPAWIPERGPVVVVPLVAAYIEHRIDGAGTAQRLATWLI